MRSSLVLKSVFPTFLSNIVPKFASTTYSVNHFIHTFFITSREIRNFSCKRCIHLRIGSTESLKRTGSYEFPICSRIGHHSRLGVECSEHVFINTFSVCTLSRSVAHSLCGVSMFYPCVLFSRE